MSSVELEHTRMVRQLDENIITLSMLGSVTSSQHSQGNVRRHLPELERKWCCLLDELSLLCDPETGGKSVTSIGVQAKGSVNVFWFASNRDTHLLIKRHLKWIVNELRSLAVEGSIDAEQVHWRLFKRSILFNRRRVENYWEILHSLVQDVQLTSTEGFEDSQLADSLKKMIGSRNNHENLCRLAFQFRDSPIESLLRQYVQQSQPHSIWQTIRHYIGRLGSWWNACSILVSTAQVDSKIFSQSRVKAICNWKSDYTTSYGVKDKGVQEWHEPSTQQEGENWQPAAHVLLRQHWGDNGIAEFNSRLQRRQTKTYIHAELLVLNHFCRYNFAFAEGVRYIGCSKLSCYCCHIYMKVHPLAVLSRPCHGNTWTRWEMPTLQDSVEGRFAGRDAELLHQMTLRTQHEIETSSFAAPKVKYLESTTGIDLDMSEAAFSLT